MNTPIYCESARQHGSHYVLCIMLTLWESQAYGRRPAPQWETQGSDSLVLKARFFSQHRSVSIISAQQDMQEGAIHQSKRQLRQVAKSYQNHSAIGDTFE